MAKLFKSIAGAAEYIDNLYHLDPNKSVFLDLADSTFDLQDEGYCWVNALRHTIRRTKSGKWSLTIEKRHE